MNNIFIHETAIIDDKKILIENTIDDREAELILKEIADE